jgi:hypothetical protein
MIWITKYYRVLRGRINDDYEDSRRKSYNPYGRSVGSNSGSGLPANTFDIDAFLLFFILVEVLSCIAAFVLAIFAFFMVQPNSPKRPFLLKF